MFKYSKTMLLIASVCSANFAYADSEKLIQVNASKQIPNKYIVVFKTVPTSFANVGIAEQTSQNVDKVLGKYGIKANKVFGNTLNGAQYTLSKGQLKQLLKELLIKVLF